VSEEKKRESIILSSQIMELADDCNEICAFHRIIDGDKVKPPRKHGSPGHTTDTCPLWNDKCFKCGGPRVQGHPCRPMQIPQGRCYHCALPLHPRNGIVFHQTSVGAPDCRFRHLRKALLLAWRLRKLGDLDVSFDDIQRRWWGNCDLYGIPDGYKQVLKLAGSN